MFRPVFQLFCFVNLLQKSKTIFCMFRSPPSRPQNWTSNDILLHVISKRQNLYLNHVQTVTKNIFFIKNRQEIFCSTRVYVDVVVSSSKCDYNDFCNIFVTLSSYFFPHWKKIRDCALLHLRHNVTQKNELIKQIKGDEGSFNSIESHTSHPSYPL